MSISVEITGKVHYIGGTQQVSDKFRKRELVIHVEDEKNPQYDDFISIQFGNDACSKLDGLAFQDEVKVQTNLRGRQYADKKTGEVKFFNSIDGWKVEVVKKAEQPQSQQPEHHPQSDETGDLPF